MQGSAPHQAGNAGLRPAPRQGLNGPWTPEGHGIAAGGGDAGLNAQPRSARLS